MSFLWTHNIYIPLFLITIYVMRLPTPEHIKSAVIDAWLRGKIRDNIALEFNISTGSVSNIIEQWQNMIGVYDANNLRDLGVALKKAKITPFNALMV